MSNQETPGIEENSGDDYFDIGLAQDTDVQGKEMQEASVEAKKITLNLKHREEESELDRAEVYAEPSLEKRARMLVKLGPMTIRYVHFRKPNPNDPMDVGGRAKPDSLMNRHAVYDALFDYGSGKVPFPHYDTFKGRLVDHEGQIFGKTIRTRELVKALDAAGMENPTDKEVTDSLRSWALDHRRDSLAEYFQRKLPEWDGKSRLETKLIDLFSPRDTELTRLVGRYFWLSIFNRITRPGAMAPLSIALIGGQDAGKSYFSLLLCRLLTGDRETGPVQLDLGAKNYNGFLRSITGKSIVANVGEMAGFKKGDMLRIKEFVSKGEDDLDFKFEDSQIKQRQWIILMDGNEYAGMQRDDTGNRRFYPIFVFQKEDENGQPAWEKGCKVNFDGFEPELWQIMAECKAWMVANGEKGWIDLVGQASRGVSEFSTMEMKQARGIVKDDGIEIRIKEVLMACDFREQGRNSRTPGIFIATSTVADMFLKVTRREPYMRAMISHMGAFGFEPKQIGVRGYFISQDELEKRGYDCTTAAMKRMIFRYGSPDTGMTDAEIDAEVQIIRDLVGGGGGF